MEEEKHGNRFFFEVSCHQSLFCNSQVLQHITLSLSGGTIQFLRWQTLAQTGPEE